MVADSRECPDHPARSFLFLVEQRWVTHICKVAEMVMTLDPTHALRAFEAGRNQLAALDQQLQLFGQQPETSADHAQIERLLFEALKEEREMLACK